MKLYAPAALLPEGWASDVFLDLGDDGRIADVSRGGSAEGLERMAGPVVPGMPNLHSHAFQRALAGRTGAHGAGRDDSFWTWRQAMYAFLDHVDADAFGAIAAQAYVEMAKVGLYDGRGIPLRPSRPRGQTLRGSGRARVARLRGGGHRRTGLTLLPVFYAHAGFGGTATTAASGGSSTRR